MSTRLKTYVCVVLAVFVLCGCAGAPADTGAERLGTIEIASDGEPSAVIVVNRECYENDGDAPNPLTGFRGYMDRRWYVWPDRLANLGQSVGRTTPWPHRTPGSINEAVTVLVDKVKKSTGAELPVVYSAPREGNVIYVGESEWTKKFGIDQSGMDMDGFEILFPDERSIVIVGPGKSGTEYGVYEFLERFAGVRWLMPGEHGVDIPGHGTIAVPRENIKEEPAFFHRTLTGEFGFDAITRWYRRMRKHHRIDQSHNLYRLFWMDDYLESHPHFYAVSESGEHLPGVGLNISWQPCFNAEGIVEEAVAILVEFFDLNPGVRKFSLGINDGGSNTFCRCPDCLAEISGEENLLGFIDYSAPYFRWASEVAEGVAEKHPDRYLYALAYQSTLEAPDFKVHPNVIVGISFDWMMMIEPGVRETMAALLSDWSEKAEIIRTGDYIYGRQYLSPRMYPRFMAEYHRMHHDYGVRARNMQTAPHFGEGPKLYAAAKLMWDPHLDIEELLEEWHNGVAGEEGGPYLQKYYDFWEDFWTRRILDTGWGRRNLTLEYSGPGMGTFLPFRHGMPGGDPTYLLDVSDEEMLQLREWMETALEKTRTDAQRWRMTVLFNAFEYYETTRLLYGAGRKEFAEAEEMEACLEDWVSAAARREELLNEVFPECPALASVRYTSADMPFIGFEHLARIFWENRDLIMGSKRLLGELGELSRETGSELLLYVHERIEGFGDAPEVDEDALREGLVLHLPFNEGEGDVIGDLSGRGNHGKVTGGRWVEDTPGGEGYSLYFDPEARAAVPHDDRLSIEDEITISVWIKINEIGEHGWLWMFSKASRAGSDANIGWIYSGTHGGDRPAFGGRIEPRANTGGRWGIIAPVHVLGEGRWYHAAATYHEERGGQFYIDTMPASPAGTRGRGKMAVNEAPLLIRHGDGMFYDLRIYNRALSEEEVMALYQLGME